MRILAKLQNMASSEILNIIPYDIYAEIKQRDPKPLFRAYVIGHEGDAKGKIVGAGSKILTWFSSAINKLFNKLQYGTKILLGHNVDNTLEGRNPIGELVGKTIKTIKDKINAIAITYIYPEFRNLPLDVASIEADITLNQDGSVHDVDVGDITGIALGNSAIDKPGFPGATLLSQLQAFADRDTTQFNEGGKMPTLQEIRDFVSKEGISPSDVFGREKLTDDPIVKGYVEEERKIASTGEWVHRDRTDKAFDKARKEWEEKEKEYKKEIQTGKIEASKIKAGELFVSKIKERKLDDKQIKFIEKKKASFIPIEPEKLDKEVDKFMDSTLEEYKETAEIFGQKIEPKPERKGGGEPSEGTTEENPFIP